MHLSFEGVAAWFAVTSGIGLALDQLLARRAKARVAVWLTAVWLRLDSTRVPDLVDRVASGVERILSYPYRRTGSPVLGFSILCLVSWVTTTAAWIVGQFLLSPPAEIAAIRQIRPHFIDQLPYGSAYAANLVCDSASVLSLYWLVRRLRARTVAGQLTAFVLVALVSVACAIGSVSLSLYWGDVAYAHHLPMSGDLYSNTTDYLEQQLERAGLRLVAIEPKETLQSYLQAGLYSVFPERLSKTLSIVDHLRVTARDPHGKLVRFDLSMQVWLVDWYRGVAWSTLAPILLVLSLLLFCGCAKLLMIGSQTIATHLIDRATDPVVEHGRAAYAPFALAGAATGTSIFLFWSLGELWTWALSMAKIP